MTLGPGVQLGPYEIEHTLGAGGMGIVYRAFDSRLQRPVAIKFITPTDEIDVSQSILTEARSASALNHPNICTVHDVAEHGDRSFIVMEYVDGRPLSDLIADGQPPPGVVLDMASQVASALAHAHERNVVHGDLKAANVLVSEAGRIKVVDFGLARRNATAETITRAARSWRTKPATSRGGSAFLHLLSARVSICSPSSRDLTIRAGGGPPGRCRTSGRRRQWLARMVVAPEAESGPCGARAGAW